jgi:hypothetical protein
VRMKGTVTREKYRKRYAGVVMDHADAVRLQTVQLVYGVWVRQTRSRVTTITPEDFRKRFMTP